MLLIVLVTVVDSSVFGEYCIVSCNYYCTLLDSSVLLFFMHYYLLLFAVVMA